MNEDMNWISRERNLKKERTETFLRKKKEIDSLYRFVTNYKPTELRPFVFSSHQAKFTVRKKRKIIFCDTHFLDITTLVAASFYILPSYDIERIANLLLSDSFVCSDDILMALEYAHKYSNGLHIAYMNAISDNANREKIVQSRYYQTFFLLCHEYSHYRFNKKDNKNDKMVLLCQKIVDISFGIDNENIVILDDEKVDLNNLKEECICDVLSLLELINIKDAKSSRIQSAKIAIDSFLLSLTSQKMIDYALNIQDVSHNLNVIYIDNRIDIELDLLPMVFFVYSRLYDDNFFIANSKELIKHAKKTAYKIKYMCQHFEKYIDSIDISSVADMYMAFNNDRYEKIYNEISRLLTLPI